MTLVSIKLDDLRRGDAACASPSACFFGCFDWVAIGEDYENLLAWSMKLTLAQEVVTLPTSITDDPAAHDTLDSLQRRNPAHPHGHFIAKRPD